MIQCMNDVMVFAPGTTEDEHPGWVSAFTMADFYVETPPMVCEAYARCFCILLFLKVKRDVDRLKKRD